MYAMGLGLFPPSLDDAKAHGHFHHLLQTVVCKARRGVGVGEGLGGGRSTEQRPSIDGGGGGGGSVAGLELGVHL